MRIFFLLCFLSMRAFAAAPEPGAWGVWFGSQYLKKRLFLHTEAQYRCFQFPSNIEQILLRGGLGYDHASGLGHAMAGFCYVYGEPYSAKGEKFISREYRPFQQIMFRQNSGRFIIFHRLRLEQRFTGSSYSDRLRYFLAINLLLNKPAWEKNCFYLSAYNELFVQSRKPDVFDRNRVYGALGWVPKKGLRIELGYMSQMLKNTSREQVMLVLYQQMKWYKEEPKS